MNWTFLSAFASVFIATTNTQLALAGNEIPLSTSPNKNPNILLIMADDVGTGDIEGWWKDSSSLVHTPNINKLIKLGVKFTDAHSSSLCAPSRYMLLSGNYQHRGKAPKGSWDMSESGNQFLSHQRSIAQFLKDENYSTYMSGKWHLGTKAMENFNYTNILSDNDWSNNSLIQGPGDIGFDTSFISLGGIQAPPYSFFKNDKLVMSEAQGIKFWKKGSYQKSNGISKIHLNEGEGDVEWDSSQYNIRIINETISYIHEHLDQNENKPFFAYVALGSVHKPHTPPTKYIDGSNVANEYQTRHLDMLYEMDKSVGALVDAIENRNIEEETLIIFTSDNGGLRHSEKFGHQTSGPLRGEKASILEGGHRVPLVFRFDKVFPSGEVRDNLVGLNDIYSTIADLVGTNPIPHGSAQDSISFAKYLSSAENDDGIRKTLSHWEYRRGQETIHATRNGDMKLIHFPQNGTYSLYNLKDDISESNDISRDPQYNDLIKVMYNQLVADGPCPDADKAHGKSFELFNNFYKTKQKQSCIWFKEKRQRCQKYLEGSLYCGKTCKRKGWCQKHYTNSLQIN